MKNANKNLLGLDTLEIIPVDEYLSLKSCNFKMTREAMIEVSFWAQNQGSFGRSEEMINKKTRMKTNSDTIRQVAEYVGNLVFEDDDKFAQETCANMAKIDVPLNKTKGTLYIEIDGAAINTRVEDENGSTWKENKLGIIFSDKDILITNSKKKNKKGNKILKKTFVSYFGNAEAFGKHLFAAAVKYNYEDYERVVFITDGATWIRNLINNYFPDAIHILDKFHLLENIHDYAKAVYKDNTVKIKHFVDRTFERILNKEFKLIYKELQNLKKADIKININLETYIKNNENKIDYRTYEKQNLFIGSGAIESSNKTIVQSRLKQAGMRWGITGAQAILTLKSKFEGIAWDSVRSVIFA